MMPPRRNCAESGFSFIEVLMAMGILLVGCVAILSLFALGSGHLLLRRIDARLARVGGEVVTLAQDALDQKKEGEIPARIADHPLSERGYSVDVDFRPSPFGGPRVVAHAVIAFQGEPVRVLPPIPLSRSTLKP